MSAITFAELEYGVAVSTQPDSDRMQLARLIEKIPVAAFDGAAGIAYGVRESHGKRKIGGGGGGGGAGHREQLR